MRCILRNSYSFKAEDLHNNSGNLNDYSVSESIQMVTGPSLKFNLHAGTKFSSMDLVQYSRKVHNEFFIHWYGVIRFDAL